jgi:uncharacterized protein (TIGR00725 family)
MPVTQRQVVGLVTPETAAPLTKELARDLGRAVISRGYHLLCSGTGDPVRAACGGAQEEKAAQRRRGRIVGDAPMVIALMAGTSRAEGNDDVDIALTSGLGAGRDQALCGSCDALVALEGGARALACVAWAWQLGKPIVLMAPTGSVLENLVGDRLDGTRDDVVLTAESADRALDLLAERLQAVAPRPRS